ncbi:pyridoxamine kinase [Blautia sp. MSJ-19]|uniref:pyridoxamine kinase n=1 Tax=Blautia sp. MSJ-19 TaxID=2841517 RepID=UPI001C0EE11E|nr:pyridoxamine kinase [Blautia sp. MSJ-19]MBU5481437.1 pyridoxamine kinase [Blautia sp. MSJ-19]
MKKIAVLNDLSGMGKCSLTAAIPVISVMGVQACPLPTAILSAQTGFPSYYCDDYTDRMDILMDEWQKMDFHPDGIYTGFLADAAQADKAVDFIQRFKKKETKVLVDPVMGDDGEEYPIYTEELCEKMRMLVREAAVITPNITEALLLLYGREKMHAEWQKISGFSGEELLEYVQTIGSLLTENFDVEAVITGISHEAEDGTKYISNLICKEAEQIWVTTKKEGGSYSGTGDLFASILSAGMVKGTDTAASVQKAVDFLAKGIHDAVEEGTDRNEGICFETYLYELADTK